MVKKINWTWMSLFSKKILILFLQHPIFITPPPPIQIVIAVMKTFSSWIMNLTDSTIDNRSSMLGILRCTRLQMPKYKTAGNIYHAPSGFFKETFFKEKISQVKPYCTLPGIYLLFIEHILWGFMTITLRNSKTILHYINFTNYVKRKQYDVD